MKLESIALRNTGPFTDRVAVGPLADGLNILTAGNEAGKTTLLVAAARALFDRHNVTGDTIERLRPAGTSLAPDITVVFTTTEGRFKIRKSFLNSPGSDLSEDREGEWHPMADGDAADKKLLDLIGGERSGRGASKAEHWGLLRYLWARQGDSAAWPAWDDLTGVRIRTSLARVDIDPLVERLAERFRDLQAANFTSTGRVAKNSPLQQAQLERERLASELVDIRVRMDDIEAQSQELAQRGDELNIRTREMTDAEQQAAALTETLKQVELVRKDLERFQNALDTAQERLKTVHNDKQALDTARTEIEKAEKKLSEYADRESRASDEGKAGRQTLTALQDDEKTLQRKLDHARKRETRIREIQELQVAERDLDELRKRLVSVRTQQQALDQLQRKRAALPDVSQRQMTTLEQLEQQIRELAIRADAVGLRVAVTPTRDASLTTDRDGSAESLDIAAGKTRTLTAARALRLDLPDWGVIQVTSGAEEAATIETKIGERQAALADELRKRSVASIDQARATVEQIKDLEREIKTADTRLTELLEDWDDPDSLATATDTVDSHTQKLRTQLDVTPTEAELSQAELKAELAAIRTAIETDEAAWTAVRESIETREKQLEACAVARSEAVTAVNTVKTRIEWLKSRTATLTDRYPDGIEQAEDNAQTAFVEAKAQLDVAGKKLPPDWEKLETRHERALKASEQAAREHRDLQQRTQKLETLLEQAGSQGLYSHAARLEEALISAESEATRLEEHALATRFLAGLIDYRKKAAVSTVLKPLEDQLSATFADITGIRNRQVFLDENLHVAGIGRKRDEAYPFEQLSQGAREQLLLALRAAVALELAKDGPQILILDDVLVNTDATRQENVLDFIETIAQQVQVLIVTCHGERYRGIGTGITIEADAS